VVTSATGSADLPIRQARPAEVDALQAVVTAAYSMYLPRMDTPPAPMTHDLTRDIAAGHVWVTGDPAVGLICLIPREHALLIENVALAPEAQGRGAGRRLLRFAETRAGELGKDRLELYTNEKMTENVALYTRLGYTETDRRTEDGHRRVFMEKRLVEQT
jgi:ribosomal protein S18 acetylase RimI-like enzyme